MSVRVLLADDTEELRVVLRRLLTRDAAIEIVAESGDGPSTVALARALRPDVVVLDLSMPGADGLTVLTQLKDDPCCAVVVLSGLPREYAEKSCLEQGAYAYVEKGSSIMLLKDAIVAAASGR